jgi:CHAT domain-containing protein/tetratricopeptide (TPR) repeat protein
MFRTMISPLSSRFETRRNPIRAGWCFLFLLSAVLSPGPLSAQTDADPPMLEFGHPVERTLSGGQVHSYLVAITAGQFVYVSVEQKGIDVVVKLIAPDGQVVAEVDSPNGEVGPEPVRFIAATTGSFRLEISSLANDARPGRYEAKLQELRTALQPDRDLLAAQRSYGEAAQLHAQLTRDSLAAAIKKYDDALTLYRRVGDQSGELVTMLAEGAAYRVWGGLEKALELASQALKLAQTTGDKISEAQSLSLASSTYRNLGDYDQALRVSDEALRVYQSLDDRPREALMLKSIGELYGFLGEPERAREFYDRSIRLYRALGDKNGEASTLRSIGYSYLVEENFSSALNDFRQALPLWQATGNRTQESIEQSFIGLEYARAGARAEATEHLAAALSLRRTNGDFNEATVLTNVAYAYAKLQEFDRAQGYFNSALVIWRTIGDKRGEAIALKHLATMLRDRGQLSEARNQADRAITLLELMRDHAGTPELQASLVASLFDFYELHIDLLMRLHAAEPAAGYDREALVFSEKVKLHSLRELLTKSRVDLHAGADPTLLARERTINDRITSTLDRLANLLKHGDIESERTAAEQELESLQSERQMVLAEIRQRSPRYSALTEPQPLTAVEIQRQVEDGRTILLEYSLGRDRSYLWAVTGDGVQSFELPAKAVIERQARQVYQLLTARQPNRALTPTQQRAGELLADRQFPAESAKLSELLLGPVAALLGTKRVLIVADGALQYLPFGVLPVPASPSGMGPTSPLPLIIDHEVVNLPSASIVTVIRRELAGRPPASKSVAVLADPVYQPDDVRVKIRAKAALRQAWPFRAPSAGAPRSTVKPASAGGERGELRRLLFSHDEAEAIISGTSNRDGLLALDFGANRRLAMSDMLAQYRILHFSTHGMLDSRHPELSGLVLSLVNEGGQPQEGFLRLHEIYNLRLNADLVVLSACQTALGKDVRGEGLIGLTRGFMYAGAPRVVASLWEVDDAATTELMKRFYRGLMQEKLPAAAALRVAQLEMLRKKHWQSPYYWGAFVLQGEWK